MKLRAAICWLSICCRSTEADGVRHEKDGDTHGWLKVAVLPTLSAARIRSSCLLPPAHSP